MNAGAFGGETWPQVDEVEVMLRSGVIETRPRDAFTVGYRNVVGLAPNEWFIAARFTFAVDDAEAAAAMQTMLTHRKQTQPIGAWSCGSVFTNPPGDHAARLIEASGLKGARRGGAVVSEKHANFIINEGSATATDVEQLMLQVRSTVRERHGIDLHPEVRVVGEP